MRASPLIACFWPGLPQLWLRGDWFGLLAALGFAVLLNVTLLATFVWPQLSRSALPVIGWLSIGCIWISSTWYSLRQRPVARQLEGVAEESAILFREAQTEYLQGHWFEAETLSQKILQQDPRDLEARLLLATLFRRTKRKAEACQQLDQLELLDGAEAWRLEIVGERRLLEESSQPAESATDLSNESEVA